LKTVATKVVQRLRESTAESLKSLQRTYQSWRDMLAAEGRTWRGLGRFGWFL